MDVLSIQELSKRTGVKISCIRQYEAKRFLPTNTSGLEYTVNVIAYVKAINVLHTIRISYSDIGQFINHDGTLSTVIDSTINRCHRRLSALEDDIANLKTFKELCGSLNILDTHEQHVIDVLSGLNI